MKLIQMALALLQLTPEILKLILEVEQVVGPNNPVLKKGILMRSVVAAALHPELSSKVSEIIDGNVEALTVAGLLPKHGEQGNLSAVPVAVAPAPAAG